jgi:pimeloyl-ACP methyl ester carboxylesterase
MAATRTKARPPRETASTAPAKTRRVRKADLELKEIELHGHRVGFRMAGEGPLVVLIHGITSGSHCWLDVMEVLARDHTVVAPDLLGHGRSAKPRGDYSLGAYASGGRDLVGALGFESGTVVGHSLGGGIALQFAYQFPEYCERLVLMSSGGLGTEVHPLLRAATLPGSELFLAALANERVVRLGAAVGSFVDRLGIKLGPDLAEFARGYGSLADAEARHAFLRTARAVIDPRGQTVSALDRLYLAEDMPTLIIWGTDDPIIPIDHGRNAHRLIPNSRLVEVPGAGHWPMIDDPWGIAATIAEFVEETEPYEFDLDRMREQLRRGAGG